MIASFIYLTNRCHVIVYFMISGYCKDVKNSIKTYRTKVAAENMNELVVEKR